MHVCLGLVVEYWSFVGTCGHHSQSKLYYLCHLASLFYPLPPLTPPLMYNGPILMNSMKKLSKTGHYLLNLVSCTKANRQLSVIMLSEQV